MSDFLPAGLHYGVPAGRYHADPCEFPSASAGILQTLMSWSAAHAWHAHPRLNIEYEAEQKDVFDYGTAAHSLLLEGDASNLAEIDANDYRTKDARAAKEDARAAGKTPILARQLRTVCAMVAEAERAVKKSELAGIFQRGKPEVTAIWQERDLWFRSRFDWLTDDHRLIIDYKTTTKAEPDAFIRGPLVQLGYDLRAAFYLRALRACGGPENAKFVWLVQEVTGRYECSVIGMGPQMAEIAERKIDYAVALWARCMETGIWNGYPNRICYAELPAWNVSNFEEMLELAGQA